MGCLDKGMEKSTQKLLIENLKRGKSQEQKRVIDFFLADEGCTAGCLSGMNGTKQMTMTEYQQAVANKLYGLNLKERALAKIALDESEIMENQRIIAENAQFTGIAAGRGVGFTTGLLHLRKGLGMRETPIRPHSWHCRMQSDYQYDGNRKRPPVWRRHRGSLRPRGRNLGRVEGMTGSCGSGCDPAIHARRLRVYHRPRRLRMASRISIFFAARRFEPLNSMG